MGWYAHYTIKAYVTREYSTEELENICKTANMILESKIELYCGINFLSLVNSQAKFGGEVKYGSVEDLETIIDELVKLFAGSYQQIGGIMDYNEDGCYGEVTRFPEDIIAEENSKEDMVAEENSEEDYNITID